MSAKGFKKKYLRYAFVVLLCVFIVSAVLLCLGLWEKNHRKYNSGTVELEDSFEYKGKEYILDKDVETFLVLGLDKYEGTSDDEDFGNDMQSDFLMLYVFDNADKTCSAIHINRDTMTKTDVLGVAGNDIGDKIQQIALAHTEGNGKEVSCRNVADAVSGLLMGRKVNHYMSVTMEAVPVFNDMVGGVEVTVLDDFAGIDDTLVKGETVNLMGEHALRYVRTRWGVADSSNTSRMARQKQYLTALYEKTLEKINEDDKFIAEASLAISDHIVSDRSVTQLQEITEKLSTYEFKGIRYIDGENKVGTEWVEFYPDEDSVKELVVDLFYEPKNN
ncbi:MAG: LytR family transcriptional regulator [Ruminococcaceae bacterium]|nr:LytR family transcriptional regulator [Oscillospiraceae bacterium]